MDPQHYHLWCSHDDGCYVVYCLHLQSLRYQHWQVSTHLYRYTQQDLVLFPYSEATLQENSKQSAVHLMDGIKKKISSWWWWYRKCQQVNDLDNRNMSWISWNKILRTITNCSWTLGSHWKLYCFQEDHTSAASSPEVHILLFWTAVNTSLFKCSGPVAV